MAERNRYDLAVIGAGSASPPWLLAASLILLTVDAVRLRLPIGEAAGA